ncbi:hypothetical protein WJX73_007942 [Symbiochloris irregularis]|uniref:F-box domain-containing protein n=1 Tax=Symbiochloris irregularis TaxID=706552 RepID=A0AAW1PLY4_9CHLO
MLEDEAELELLELPGPLLERIFALLSIRDLAAVAQCSQHCKRVAQSDQLWLQLCHNCWGSRTRVTEWLVDRPRGCFALPLYQEIAPTNYRALYRLLSVLQNLEGLWRKSENSHTSPTSLCQFQWTSSSLQGFVFWNESLYTPPQRNKGVYGAHGIQILAVEYTFAGPAAKICATKVAGPPMHIGPGEPSWTAAVAPLPKPWPVREAAAIAMRWNLARGDDHLLSSQSDPHLREESKQVVACFNGRGWVAGAAAASKQVDGRLWLYDNGDLGFVWLDDVQLLIDFQRIDSSLS